MILALMDRQGGAAVSGSIQEFERLGDSWTRQVELGTRQAHEHDENLAP